MNKYVRAMVCVPICIFKMSFINVVHLGSVKICPIGLVSPFTEITIEKKATIKIGKRFKMRDGAKIRVRNSAILTMGDNVSVNSNNMIVCHNEIQIGNNVQLSPNVQIYDHDHDYNVDGGIAEMRYKTSSIVIGDNVWIGANSIILRGTKIGDNSVIAAGSVIKGEYPPNSLIYQKKETISKNIM